VRRAVSRLIVLVLGLVALLGLAAPGMGQTPEGPAAPPETVDIVLFHSATCPHCAAELAWLQDYVDGRDDVVLREYEITGSAPNRALFAATAERLDFEVTAVPVTVVADEYVFVGFNDFMAVEIDYAVTQLLEAAEVDPGRIEPGATTDVDVPVFGRIDLGDRSLVVATLLIGLLDGVNPCSLWVLSLLLALVIHTRSRRRVLLVGAVFLTITTALYGLYMLGAYSILQYIAYVGWIRIGVASIAGVMGVVNLLDAFDVDIGVKLRIADQRKPKLISRMRGVARTDARLPATIGATAALAVGVSLIETPCTAGFPLMWSNLLVARGVEGAGAAGLFGLYMLVFLLDELVVFIAAVWTMRAAKLQAAEGRLLKLAGGVVMLTLAGVMIMAPTLLESLPGTFAVFGGAAVAVGLLWLLVRPAPGEVGAGRR
jgi:glutaredoxin